MNADRGADDPHGDAAEGPHPETGHVVEPDDATTNVGGCIQLDLRLGHGAERQLEKAGGEQ